MALSRQALPLLLLALPAGPALAQQATADDVLAASREVYGPPPDSEPCTAEQEAASISGEIVVCRRRAVPSDQRLSSDRQAEARYAAATMDMGDPRAPDFAGPPCDTKKAGCIGFGYVKPRAMVIDFAALPEAPPGSDADRIARGLAPLGNDGNSAAADARIAAELGLPDTVDGESGDAPPP